ncbi:ABC-type lipoprotein export system ATPase subunit [Dysgonomonas sp. PH5-45]|uniref:AAA family ATPase n=1 Tax=unclassified Dysgonomonas TaxID=2630389 RepID=UPI002475D962|nr:MULTISPECIES: ATP-binding protein [unclassified Dysgonomonas]MDH6354618.1 ABC-type lipoprotein export system ATPase subunit [Dysgonomonas sp. PH5-45]MDH6387516.1 ABC-type lipoprotein export system ATPase subunit [Dysgonomonas sp. PH5-37]
MLLEAIKYIRQKGGNREWAVEDRYGSPIQFGNINLIVGKNASGKSRTLAIIREIADLLNLKLKLSELPFRDCHYYLQFNDEGEKYEYSVSIDNEKILDEQIFINGQPMLNRKEGKIYSTVTKQLEPFNLDNTILAVKKHGAPEYSFLSKLFAWGHNLRKSAFTNQFEKNTLIKDFDDWKRDRESNMHANNSRDVVRVVHRAQELFGNEFNNNILHDMKVLGYPMESIEVLDTPDGYSLYVKEDELDAKTSQLEMSQGMFRALSFIVHLNYALLKNRSICILVDDLGEGLDFDRSKALISLLIYKSKGSNVQLIITTNDRYIMNSIPIKYWSIAEREAKKTVFYNYYNSQEFFDDFKFTGLSNFDFLATHFYINGFEESDDSIELQEEG